MWRSEGLRYYRLSHYLRNRFHRPVRKLSLDGHFGCPNVDGTIGTGGCVFCNVASFSPSRRGHASSLSAQFQEGSRRLRSRHGSVGFIAYFQPATNSYSPLDRLRALWAEAISFPDVVGLAVATRPDCVPDEILDLLQELAGKTWVSVEYGLQTIHDRTLDWINRGHHYDAFLDACRRSHQRGLDVGAHVILGLPGETREDMLATAGELGRLKIHSVKIHNLCVVKDTVLAEKFTGGKVALPPMDRYVDYVIGFLEKLHPRTVIDRLCADAPPEYLIAPEWCADKAAVRQAIEDELRRRDTRQGRRCLVLSGQ